MGYDLAGAGGRFRYNGFVFSDVLKLAVKHEWKPMGTIWPKEIREAFGYESDKDAKWDGRYNTNEFQVVLDEDARNIAEALSKVTDTDLVNRLNLKEFIKFCRAGEFSIG